MLHEKLGIRRAFFVEQKPRCALLVSIGVSNNLSGPEGFEEVGHVIEVHITATAADTVLGHNDLFGVRMLLCELRYSLLVIVVNMLL